MATLRVILSLVLKKGPLTMAFNALTRSLYGMVALAGAAALAGSVMAASATAQDEGATTPAPAIRWHGNNHPRPEFPATAAQNGVTAGEVVLSCKFNARGNPTFCMITSETPARNGFAAAAMRATRSARADMRYIAVDTPTNVTINFSVD